MNISRRSFLQLSGAAALSTRWALAGKDQSTDALCRKLAADPLRPQYHLMPAHNWMNDPNGPIFFRGQYHMFHQYNPKGAVWGNMNWAHATSPDMIHWKHEPIAISPTPNGYDRDGVFSGSAVLDHGKPTMIYTGILPATTDAQATLRDGTHIWREVQCLAVAGDDDLRIWKKLPEPVIAAPPKGIEVTGFRDPFVWREGNDWMLILGSGFLGKGGAILLYTSTDLRHWTYLHPLVEGPGNGLKSANPVDTGEMWECPDFFPLGKKHVLLISTMGKVHWKVGTYSNRIFTPEKEGVVDWGSYYAAKTMLDKDGQRILWGWISENRSDADLIAAGWAGAMSLPRVLSLNSENELETQVAPAARVLRGAHTTFSTRASLAEREKALTSLRIENLAAEMQIEVQPKADQLIRLESESGELVATISSMPRSEGRVLQVNSTIAPLVGGVSGAPVRLHLFLDGSVLEVFANGTTSVTARVYQRTSGSLRLKVGEAEIKALDVWQMNPISKDRLTGSMCA